MRKGHIEFVKPEQITEITELFETAKKIQERRFDYEMTEKLKRCFENNEELSDEDKKLFNEEMSRRATETKKERRQRRVVENARMMEYKYKNLYKQWKNNELPGKALISELQPVIEQLNKDIKIFEGEHLDKSGFMYPSMVETSPEIMEKVINRLQAFMDELKQEATPPQSVELQASKTNNENNILQFRIMQVSSYYTSFQKDLSLLRENGFVEDNGDYLHWEKSKKSLSEYFGYQKTPAKWGCVEILFNVRDLKNSFSTNGNASGKKVYSADYIHWLKIKKIP